MISVAIPRSLLYRLAAVASLLALPSLAKADSPLDFTLKNRLGLTITAVYISPHHSDSWEENVLGNRSLADNKDRKILFGDGEAERGDMWDLKIRTADGKEYIWREPGFNLKKISEITIILKDGKVTALYK